MQHYRHQSPNCKEFWTSWYEMIFGTYETSLWKKNFKIPTFCAHFSNLIFSWYRTLRSKIPCAMTTIFPKDFIHTQQHNFWTHFFTAYEGWNRYHCVELKKCGILIYNMSYTKFFKPEKSGKNAFCSRTPPHAAHARRKRR